MRIGLDLDGVIVDHREHKRRLAAARGFMLERWQTNSNVMGNYIPQEVYEELSETLYTRMTPDAPPVAGAIDALAAIPGELYIVSARADDSVRYAQQWLLKHRLYDVIPAERIFFCGSGSEKRGYCERLGLSLFLDDKLSVLERLPPRTTKVLFDADDIARDLQLGDGTHVVSSWNDFVRLAVP